MRVRIALLFLGGFGACVPPGNSTPTDSGPAPQQTAAQAPTFTPSTNVMTQVFEDNFDRAPAPAKKADAAPTLAPAPSTSASAEASTAIALASGSAQAEAAAAPADDLGPDWSAAAGSNAWHIEYANGNGKLCGRGAHNKGVWLNRTLPVNARIEFDAISDATDGDLKAEVWGDGRSAATSISYTNATSYLIIFGGWKNKFHKIARINEHGKDAKEITVDPNSDDPREKPVIAGQIYRFKVERTDSKTVRWFVDGVEFLNYPDTAPLLGAGHDHFGFNDWEVKVCFDNVKVTPLP